MTMEGVPPASAALDNAEAAIVDGKEQVEEQRAAALAQADTDAQRNAINGRFDRLDTQLETLHERVTSATSESVQAVVGPIGETLRGIETQLAAIAGGGAAAAGDDDGIESIEEIADDAGATVGEAVESVEGSAGEVADQVDKAPARGHVLFRKLWGG